MPHEPASGALKHLTILDLTHVRSGPTCVRQFADWGANVIRVETPAALEEDGSVGARRATPDSQNLHRNKRSITIDLKHPDGQATFLRLVKGADIVVENFRPQVKHRLGVDYETLHAANPRIILGSISGFGQTGPDCDRPGFDQIAQGMGGLMSVTGEPGRGPMRAGIPVADLSAGLFCALGIMVALAEREISGQGQWVQTSLLQAQAFMLDFQAARYLMAGVVPGQAGNNHPTSIPTGVFPTSDGHINIAAPGDRIWKRLCRALGKEAWLEDARFDSHEKRSENRDVLNPMISEVLKAETSEHWVGLLTAKGVACGHIYDLQQMFANEQVEHLGIAAKIRTDEFGDTRMLAQPIELSRTPSRLVTAPPARGQHNAEVLAEFGLSEDEIADLQSRKVI
ncbi:MAG: CaiB/BaiF CoA-transferase family protein [Alphaproteobacteria bacterium]